MDRFRIGDFPNNIQIGDYPNISLAQTGWICPVCGRGLAPWISQCSCKNNFDYTIKYTTITSAEKENRNE